MKGEVGFCYWFLMYMGGPMLSITVQFHARKAWHVARTSRADAAQNVSFFSLAPTELLMNMGSQGRRLRQPACPKDWLSRPPPFWRPRQQRPQLPRVVGGRHRHRGPHH